MTDNRSSSKPSIREQGGTQLAADAGQGPTAQHLQRLSRLMDSSIRLPGGFRIGWDAIIGLIPGFGDLAGAGISAYIVLGAARLGAPKGVIVRMLANVAIESVVGAIPLVGDLFDMTFKANMRNMRLLDGHLSQPVRTRRQSKGWLLLWAAVLVLLFVLLAWLVIAVLGAVFGLLFGS